MVIYQQGRIVHGIVATVPASQVEPMPATMFTVVRTVGGYGKSKRHLVTLPQIDALLDERLKYFTLPDDELGATRPRAKHVDTTRTIAAAIRCRR